MLGERVAQRVDASRQIGKAKWMLGDEKEIPVGCLHPAYFIPFWRSALKHVLGNLPQPSVPPALAKDFFIPLWDVFI